MDPPPFYIADSSSLINLRQYYPFPTFKTLWQKMDYLIHNGHLKIPDQVFEEIQRKDDSIASWLRDRKDHVVIPATPYQGERISELIQRYPKIIDVSSERIQADPWVIACALDYRDGPQQRFSICTPTIITEEKIAGNKPKIPTVCRDYHLASIKLVDMMIAQGWEF